MELVIFGAQAIALGTYNAIKELYPDCNIECFLVTSLDNNPKTLAGLQVEELYAYSENHSINYKENILVIIATPENVMNVIEETLRENKFTNIHRLDSIEWARLQEKYYTNNKIFQTFNQYNTGSAKPQIKVFMAKFWKDKPLTSIEAVPEYMVPIQVGTALTDVRVADILDNVGDNISAQNGNYSELTALYWIWKNAVVDNSYYGLAHYRRFLMLTDTELSKLQGDNIDVVLPYPMPYEPSMEMHRKRYLAQSEWNAVLQALEELYPEYGVALQKISNQKYMYNYNIFVAKGNVLNQYCEWLFTILFRVEEINNPCRTNTPNRYLGYIAETLETLFFMYNKDKFKIVHTGCRFLT